MSETAAAFYTGRAERLGFQLVEWPLLLLRPQVLLADDEPRIPIPRIPKSGPPRGVMANEFIGRFVDALRSLEPYLWACSGITHQGENARYISTQNARARDNILKSLIPDRVLTGGLGNITISALPPSEVSDIPKRELTSSRAYFPIQQQVFDDLGVLLLTKAQIFVGREEEPRYISGQFTLACIHPVHHLLHYHNNRLTLADRTALLSE